MNIFNSLLVQLVKYDVHTTRKINSIHAIFYHISFYTSLSMQSISLGLTSKLKKLITTKKCQKYTHWKIYINKRATQISYDNLLPTATRYGGRN